MYTVFMLLSSIIFGGITFLFLTTAYEDIRDTAWRNRPVEQDTANVDKVETRRRIR